MDSWKNGFALGNQVVRETDDRIGEVIAITDEVLTVQWVETPEPVSEINVSEYNSFTKL